MFFDNVDDVAKIASKSGTSIFVIPDNLPVTIKNAILLAPEQKSIITIDQIREVLKIINNKQQKDQFVIIRPADKLGDAAANAILKNLEEPVDKIHFVLITENISSILPTVLSRASIYFLKDDKKLDAGLSVDDKTKELAKRLLAAKASELVDLADEITKNKGGSRAYALNIVGAAIEILYKSYFLTSKAVFLNKLPKFLALYDAINRNGHIKLQILAHLC
ncbi:hypothetical protein IKF32_02580 [Candidatus Saccharibacteria bacterium]|nr:hypothetical protein [Candidatus Saccharibacteria bacterium]